MSCPAHLDARPDKTEELGSLLTSLLAPTRQEQGCVRFELQQTRDSLTEFAIVSEWRGEDAVRHHITTNYAQHALGRLPDRFAGSPILPLADVGRTADITNVTQFPLSEILP